jgi:hypothetical protein
LPTRLHREVRPRGQRADTPRSAPETTYILTDIDFTEIRRIFTDGRDWPTDIEPAYLGYSIGRWIDEDGDGRYTVLVPHDLSTHQGAEQVRIIICPYAFIR